MNEMNFSTKSVETCAPRRSGFTLVEIMVAIAILGVLLTVILVPLRLGFETFTVGKARAETQQQAQNLVNRIADDLRKSQFVFSNSYIAGINDNGRPVGKCSPPPYPATAAPNWESRPYIRSNDPTKTGSSGSFGVCDTAGNGTTGVQAWNNPTRIEMLQQRRNNNGNVLNTDAGQDFIISYYPRRLDINKPFDLLDNPIVLFRAQIPFRTRDANGVTAPVWVDQANNVYHADVDVSHLPASIGACGTGATAPKSRSFQWLNHNYYGEADLEPLAVDALGVPAAHTLVTPRDMSLVAPRAAFNEPNAYVPELSFREESSDGRVIDRVVITLTLAQYDQSGTTSNNNQAGAQRVRVSQTVELPNAAACSVQ